MPSKLNELYDQLLTSLGECPTRFVDFPPEPKDVADWVAQVAEAKEARKRREMGILTDQESSYDGPPRTIAEWEAQRLRGDL
jgi:hypothetical protein